MTLEQLRILKYIIDYGSLKEAALKLHKTQPALSMAIKKLETEFGFQILDRSQYRLRLTAQGRIFYREAQVLINGSEQLKSLAQQLAQGNEALFSIAYEHICPEKLILPAIQQTYQKFPATELQLQTGSRFSALKEVTEDKADLGIGPWFNILHAQGDYETFSIGQFQLLIVASPKLVNQQTIYNYKSLSQLPNIDVIENQFNLDTDKQLYQVGNRQMKVSDIHSLKALLLAGVGWGLVPYHHVSNEISSGELVAIELTDKEYQFSGDIRVFRKENKTFGPVAQFIWQALAQE